MPMQSFVANDREQFARAVRKHLGASTFDCEASKKPFVGDAYWADTKYVRVTRARCNRTMSLSFDDTPHVKQFFLYDKTSNLSLEFNGRRESISRTKAALIVPAHTPHVCSSKDHHDTVTLRIPEDALRQVASAMLGEQIQGELALRDVIPGDRAFAAMKRAALELTDELSALMTCDSYAADCLGQALVVRFLLLSQHKTSNRMDLKPLSPSAPQLKQIEEFIAANYARNIDIEEIARTFGIGSRSVFRYFKDIRGMTPHAFIRQIKLDAARHFLTTAKKNDSVMAIGLRCGFHGLGHFSREYKLAFGEYPSATLRNARSKQRR